jgi:hypothetical protein
MSALSIGLTPTQQNMLDGQHRAGTSLHIGTDNGVLTLTAHDDAAGTHLQVELKTHDAITAICGTHLLCDTRFAKVHIAAAAGSRRATIWVGSTRWHIPFELAGLVHAWLARTINPRTVVDPLPAGVAEALARIECEVAA